MYSQFYKSGDPYPEVSAARKNAVYAREMLGNVGGGVSEMTAVSLYVYDSMVALDEDIAQAFHKISIVEMHHLHIFSELARQLGADPRLWEWRGRSMQYWTPRHNRYYREPRELLRYALESELEAIRKYERQAAEIRDGNIVENLVRILADERLHAQMFRQMLSELGEVV